MFLRGSGYNGVQVLSSPSVLISELIALTHFLASYFLGASTYAVAMDAAASSAFRVA